MLSRDLQREPTRKLIKESKVHIYHVFDGSSAGSSMTIQQCVIFGASIETGCLGLVLNSLSKSDSFNIYRKSR